MTEPQPTICIVDDDPPVRKSLSRLLQESGFDVITFASPREFLDECEMEDISCLVLDYRMPEFNGLEIQEALVSRAVELPIVFLTGYGDIPVSVQAMKGGAVNFLTKPVEECDLLASIGEAVEKHRDACQQRGRTVEIRSRIASLTPRERQVLGYVIGGEPNKRIAAELGTSEKTIKVHRSRVMTKMKVRSVAELVRLTEHVGITPSPRIR